MVDKITTVPKNKLGLRIGELDDLRPWLGEPVHGALTANVELAQAAGHPQATIRLDGRNAGVPGARVDHVTVTGRVEDPTNHAVAQLQLVAEGIASNGVTGNLRLDASGPQQALKLKLTSELHHASQGDVPLNATATLDATGKTVSIASLQAQ